MICFYCQHAIHPGTGFYNYVGPSANKQAHVACYHGATK